MFDYYPRIKNPGASTEAKLQVRAVQFRTYLR
jgi:hypothetical protein